MPYINRGLRQEIDQEINALMRRIEDTAIGSIEPDGMINYAITRMMHRFFMGRYTNYERGIGCLECVKLEFYRQSVAVYEDDKKAESGDVD